MSKVDRTIYLNEQPIIIVHSKVKDKLRDIRDFATSLPPSNDWQGPEAVEWALNKLNKIAAELTEILEA